MALVAAPILLLVDPRLVPGPLLVAVLAVTILMTGQGWRDAARSTIGWAVVGGIPGILLGAWITASFSTDILRGFLGLLILAAVILSALGHRVHPSRAALVAAGGASGVMGAVVAIGGPPLALLLQHVSGGELRRTLAGYFTLSSIAVLAALATFGSFGRVELALAWPLVPAALVGYVLSGPLVGRLDRRQLRLGILGLSAAAGVAVVVRYWF